MGAAVQHRPAADGAADPADSAPEAPDHPVGETAPVDVGPADRDAEFTAFVRAHSLDLSRTAWLLCGDAGRAEELVQAALVRTYVAWPTARQGEPLAYARRVLANLRIDSWRARRREVLTEPGLLPDGAARGGVDGGFDGVGRRDELVRALLRLPVQRRRVVVLRHVLDLSERQVADDLGISVGAVKSAASRGLAQLREELRDARTGRDGDDGGRP